MLYQKNNNEKTYLTSILKKGKKLDFGSFTINSKNKSMIMNITFNDVKNGYPAVDLQDLYLEDEEGNKIY